MSLANALEKYAGNYEKLFKGEYLINDGKKWQIARKAIKENEKQPYFDSLAKSLITAPFAGILHFTDFLKKFNSEWSAVILKATGTVSELRASDMHEPILFSSKIEKFAFLSNFFGTLILVEDETGEKLFYSVETAYVAEKLKKIDPTRVASAVVSTSSLKAKKMGKSAQNLEVWSSEEKLAVMKKLVPLKFAYNPFIADLLKKTGNRELLEATNDAFWGIGAASLSQSDPSPQPPSGENHLGKILMEVRKTLS